MNSGTGGTARPDLSGLFNGSAAPDRATRPIGGLRPILIKSGPIDDGAQTPPVGPRTDRTAAPPERTSTAVPWFDPVALVGGYFQLAQALLDAQRAVALDWAAFLSGLPRRVLPRR